MELSEAEYRLEAMDMDDICDRATGLNIRIPDYAAKEEAIKIVMAYFENEDGHEQNGDAVDAVDAVDAEESVESEDAEESEAESEDAEDAEAEEGGYRHGDIPPSEIEEDQYCENCEKRLILEISLCKNCSADIMIEC
jgi:hypothetical protein